VTNGTSFAPPTATPTQTPPRAGGGIQASTPRARSIAALSFRKNKMTSRWIDRIGGLAGFALFALFAGAGPAAADKDAETYIGANAQSAISALAATGAPAARSAKFAALMAQFADVGEMSSRMLGVYARAFRDDPALKAEWTDAFRDYAMATYEDQLDRFRASRITVTGSRDADQNGKTCSRVSTQLNQTSGKPAMVFWYVCKSGPSAWRVTDVGLDTGGGEIKALLNERAQFESVLGQNGGNIENLISRLRARTVAVRARIAAKNG
jgi:phospholipid transport system substrate-binding protein